MKCRSKFWRSLSVAVAAIALAGCGADGSATYTKTPTEQTETAQQPYGQDSPSETEMLGDFEATLLSGEKFVSANVLAQQPLALWFWAPG
ncbi:MAG: hypothetical protein FJW19_01415 [Actinobacteria bacterium]|nr:hypothetical protein [Actinomycetota bacterium]